MALGNNPRQVFKLVVTENVLLGVVGSLLGIVFGSALAVAISAIGIPMPPPPNANIGYTALVRVVPAVLTMAFTVGMVATIAAAIFPARRVARIPVVDALRQNH